MPVARDRPLAGVGRSIVDAQVRQRVRAGDGRVPQSQQVVAADRDRRQHHRADLLALDIVVIIHSAWADIAFPGHWI